MSRRRAKRPPEPAAHAGGDDEPTLHPWLPPALLLAIPLLASFSRIGAPLYYDEAYTIMRYASLPYAKIVTDYSEPNNHVAHTLMLHSWSLLIGDPTMIRADTGVLRLPALALTALGLAAFFLAARRLVDSAPLTAAAATAFFFCHGEVLPLSLALRGYGPSVALMCVGLALIAWQDRVPRPLYAIALGLVILLVNYMVPSNVWFTAPLAVAAVLSVRAWPPEQRPPVLPAVVAGALGFGLTVLAYLPIADQMRAAAGGDRSLAAVLAQLPRRFVDHWKMLLGATGYGPWPLSLALIAAGAVALVRLGRSDDAARRAALIALPVVALWSPVATALTQSGFTRNYVPGHPLFALVQIWALVALARGLAHGLPERALVGAFAAVALVNGFTYASSYGRDMQPDEVIRLVKMKSGDRTLVLVGEFCELAAHSYYARVQRVEHRVVYYQGAPPELVRRWHDVWFLHTGERDLVPMLKYHGITPEDWRSASRRVAVIGGTYIDALSRGR